jgi:hypothetical protein
MSAAGRVHPIVLTNGVRMPSERELERMLGLGPGQLGRVRQMAFASSKPAVPILLAGLTQ